MVAAALRSRTGASFALLRAVQHGQLRMLATPALFLEYEDVLKRPEQRQISGLTLRDADLLLAELAALIEPVEVHLLWRPQLRDANDEMVLEAAINGRADALVTHNVRDFRAATPLFGIRLARPIDMLKEL